MAPAKKSPSSAKQTITSCQGLDEIIVGLQRCIELSTKDELWFLAYLLRMARDEAQRLADTSNN